MRVHRPLIPTLPVPKEIALFVTCKRCGQEMPAGQSPETWARLNVGITRDRGSIQIWCVRHDIHVASYPLLEPEDDVQCMHPGCARSGPHVH
jgi:hypothetical protein